MGVSSFPSSELPQSWSVQPCDLRTKLGTCGDHPTLAVAQPGAARPRAVCTRRLHSAGLQLPVGALLPRSMQSTHRLASSVGGIPYCTICCKYVRQVAGQPSPALPPSSQPASQFSRSWVLGRGPCRGLCRIESVLSRRALIPHSAHLPVALSLECLGPRHQRRLVPFPRMWPAF